MKSANMNQTRGFTLIELMIVVAIVAILAAIAIPAYQDYVIRSQVTEGASLTAGAKTAVEEYYANFGVAPTTNAAAGLDTNTNIKGKYVTKVDVGAAGVIQATFGGSANAAIANKVLQLTPAFTSGSTDWQCKAGTTIDTKYLPSVCR